MNNYNFADTVGVTPFETFGRGYYYYDALNGFDVEHAYNLKEELMCNDCKHKNIVSLNKKVILALKGVVERNGKS